MERRFCYGGGKHATSNIDADVRAGCRECWVVRNVAKADAPPQGPFEVTFPGPDPQPGATGNIQATYENGKRTSLSFPAKPALEKAATQIETFVRANDWSLPSDDQAAKLLENIEDPWGNQRIGLEGSTVPEVSEAMDMTETAVRVALHRGLKKLAGLRGRMIE